MPPKYILTYFYFRAKGENIRQLLQLAGVEFEDRRIQWEQWPHIKKEMPFAQMPVLECEEGQLAQSKAIGRFLTRKYGFAGSNDWEAARIDALVDQFEDFFQEIRPFYRTYNKIIEGDLDNVYETIVQPARDKHLPLFSKFLDENPSGFLVGSKLSWIDTQLADHLYTFMNYSKGDYTAQYPQLAAFKERIHATPRLREWIKDRPKTVI
ncbi:unnamed protein product, partial [Mesorhabditis spiculigera]